MRVLSITPTFYPAVGGIEQVVEELAHRVAPLGVQMDIAHVAPGLAAAQEEVRGLSVYRVPLHGHRLVGWAPGLAAVARGYELLHVHDPQLMAITANVRSRCGAVPAVLSTHGGFWHTQQHRSFKRAYEATLLPRAALHYRRILASSVGDLEYFRRLSSRVVLCANGVHVERFGRAVDGPQRSPLRWVYWGRLSRNKRVDLAIDYVAHARHLGHEADLLVCGRDFDQLLPALKAQVERLGLQAAVRFVPFLDDDDLVAELSTRGVFVTASEHEGFGLSVVEAMSAGLIVACRDITPLNAFFRDREAGWFLRFDGSPGDLEALRGLVALEPAAALGLSQAARRAAAPYNWDEAAKRFVAQYNEVLAAPAPFASASAARI